MIDKLFDFDKAYSAGVVLDGEYVASVITFPNNLIKLTLTILDSNKQSHFLENTLISGFVSTKKGTWFFSSNKFFQTEFSYENETYILNEFIVCDEKFYFKDLKSLLININFDNLIRLDNYIILEENEKKFEIIENFKEIIFNDIDLGPFKLINFHKNNFKTFREEYFIINKKPIIELRRDAKINFEELKDFINKLSFYFQLIFDVKQSVTDLEIFAAHPNKSDEYVFVNYYHSKIILSKMNQIQDFGFKPTYFLKDLITELNPTYSKWSKVISSNETLIRLFFNEINSSNYILDDRFKNLCSIIQGLRGFAFIVQKNKLSSRNQMHSILHASFDSAFIHLIEEITIADFIDQLLVVIAEMRDFFQHLNKRIRTDLSNHSESMNCINSLLKINIRYHLLKKIELSDLYIKSIIKTDLRRIDLNLVKLRKKLIIMGAFSPS